MRHLASFAALSRSFVILTFSRSQWVWGAKATKRPKSSRLRALHFGSGGVLRTPSRCSQVTGIESRQLGHNETKWGINYLCLRLKRHEAHARLLESAFISRRSLVQVQPPLPFNYRYSSWYGE